MRYWKFFAKSGNPDAPDFIFRFCEKVDKRGCLERWDGKKWVDASWSTRQKNVRQFCLEDILFGEPGGRVITEQEATDFIAAEA